MDRTGVGSHAYGVSTLTGRPTPYKGSVRHRRSNLCDDPLDLSKHSSESRNEARMENGSRNP
jgi:hypothetical protein